jgi:hypothetical protein
MALAMDLFRPLPGCLYQRDAVKGKARQLGHDSQI